MRPEGPKIEAQGRERGGVLPAAKLLTVALGVHSQPPICFLAV